MKHTLILMIVISLSVLFSGFAAAQKGMGEDTGILRQGLIPSVTRVTGELLEIRTGPCEKTTGKAKIGTHLIIQAEDGQKLNIHLGPEYAVDHVVEQLSIKQRLSLEVFHTEKMPANAYIAKSLSIDDKVIHIRDDNLRPSWAGFRGTGRGQGMRQGRGNRGPCW